MSKLGNQLAYFNGLMKAQATDEEKQSSLVI